MGGVSQIIASSLQPFDIHICFAGYVFDYGPYKISSSKSKNFFSDYLLFFATNV
jgi:hypothetical protein